MKTYAKVFVEMPHRNSMKQDQHATLPRRSPRFRGNNTMIQPEPTTVLRRSSRILARKRDESADPKTPEQEKKGAVVPFLGTSACVSTPKGCVKGLKRRNSVARNVLKESNLGEDGRGKGDKGSGMSEQLKDGGEDLSCLRRSSRLSSREKVNSKLVFDEFKKGEEDLGNKDVLVRRNSARRVCKETGFDGKSLGMVVCDSANQESVEVVTGLPVQSLGQTKKTGNSNQGKARKLGKKCIRKRIDKSAEESKAELLGKGSSLSVEKISKSGLGETDQKTVGGSSIAPVKGRVENEARAVEKKPKCVGVKRKRNQVEDGCENNGTVSDWTKEQEAALQKSYYAANPTPRFWKDVARMVPGKSAQDCFNRIHADCQTPRQTQPRVRARKLNSSPLSYSASKLLDSIRPKSKRPGHTKRKGHLVKKTMRDLLQKQCQVNREQNADIFSLLEPDVSPSPIVLQQGVNCSTPKQANPKVLKRCQETSSSAQRKQHSRSNSINEASVASPPVLKPVKNKVLHNKYLDLLHAREAKRKAVSARAAKSSLQIQDKKECRVQKNAVESAKNALLLNAKNAINQFQHMQANDLSSFPGDDDVVFSDEDSDEGEN